MCETAQAPSASYRDQGNAEYAKENYLKAAALYTQGLKEHSNDAALLRLVGRPGWPCCEHGLERPATQVAGVRDSASPPLHPPSILQQQERRAAQTEQGAEGSGGCRGLRPPQTRLAQGVLPEGSCAGGRGTCGGGAVWKGGLWGGALPLLACWACVAVAMAALGGGMASSGLDPGAGPCRRRAIGSGV